MTTPFCVSWGGEGGYTISCAVSSCMTLSEAKGTTFIAHECVVGEGGVCITGKNKGKKGRLASTHTEGI